MFCSIGSGGGGGDGKKWLLDFKFTSVKKSYSDAFTFNFEEGI
jgi:hypothetical protein